MAQDGKRRRDWDSECDLQRQLAAPARTNYRQSADLSTLIRHECNTAQPKRTQTACADGLSPTWFLAFLPVRRRGSTRSAMHLTSVGFGIKRRGSTKRQTSTHANKYYHCKLCNCLLLLYLSFKWAQDQSAVTARRHSQAQPRGQAKSA